MAGAVVAASFLDTAGKVSESRNLAARTTATIGEPFQNRRQLGQKMLSPAGLNRKGTPSTDDMSDEAVD
jgi:hypothetical protein